jgi:hypothetical protein
VLGLGALIAVLATVASGIGLFAQGGPGPLHRRRSLRGTLVLIGVLAWLLYYYASMSLATAYNRAFPLYVALLAATIVALPATLLTVDAQQFADQLPARPSRRVLLAYPWGLAAVLVLAWVPSLGAAGVSGQLPARLGNYTTEVTWALDVGVVLPAVAGASSLLYRRSAYGPWAAAAMISLNVALGLALLGQGIAQVTAGVPMNRGEVIGAMASFTAMTAVATVLFVPLLRGLPAPKRTNDPSVVVASGRGQQT